MQIAANKAVSIDYTLTNDAGEVIDSSAGGAPLVYLHGCGNIIVGLEKALEGKQTGDQLTVTIEPEDAYGEYSAELVAVLDRAMFEGVDELVQEVFRLPARTGRPAPWSGRRDEDPCCSTAAGTVALVLGDDGGLGWRDQVQVSMLSNRLARLGQWFRENF